MFLFNFRHLLPENSIQLIIFNRFHKLALTFNLIFTLINRQDATDPEILDFCVVFFVGNPKAKVEGKVTCEKMARTFKKKLSHNNKLQGCFLSGYNFYSNVALFNIQQKMFNNNIGLIYFVFFFRDFKCFYIGFCFILNCSRLIIFFKRIN